MKERRTLIFGLITAFALILLFTCTRCKIKNPDFESGLHFTVCWPDPAMEFVAKAGFRTSVFRFVPPNELSGMPLYRAGTNIGIKFA